MATDNKQKTLSKVVFEQFFKEQFVPLSNFAYQYVKDKDAAKDLVQKVFIKLWERKENMNPNHSIKSYLFTSVKNLSLNYIRDNKKYQSRFLDFEIEDIEEVPILNEEKNTELEDAVSSALALLPNKCRKVFEMSRFQQMKYKEIAEELEVSVKTVEAHMSKALKTLRIELKDYMYLLIIILNYLP